MTLTSRLTSVRWSWLQSSLRCRSCIFTNPIWNFRWPTLSKPPSPSPPTAPSSQELSARRRAEARTTIWPQERQFDLSLTKVLSQASCSAGGTVVVTVSVFPAGTAHPGKKARLRMTNSFAAYLNVAQSEMVYEELVRPASGSLLFPPPSSSPANLGVGATDRQGSQMGSNGQRTCSGSVQVFPMFLMREAVPAPPSPRWDRVCTCRPSPGLSALSVWAGGLQYDPKSFSQQEPQSWIYNFSLSEGY